MLKIKDFLTKHYLKIIYLIFLVGWLYFLFFFYQYFFSLIFLKQKETQFLKKQELNIKGFEQILETQQKKSEEPLANIRNLF